MYILLLFSNLWNRFTIDPFPMKFEFQLIEFQLFPIDSKENRVSIPGKDGNDDSLPPIIVVVGVDLIGSTAKHKITIVIFAKGMGLNWTTSRVLQRGLVMDPPTYKIVDYVVSTYKIVDYVVQTTSNFKVLFVFSKIKFMKSADHIYNPL